MTILGRRRCLHVKRRASARRNAPICRGGAPSPAVAWRLDTGIGSVCPERNENLSDLHSIRGPKGFSGMDRGHGICAGLASKRPFERPLLDCADGWSGSGPGAELRAPSGCWTSVTCHGKAEGSGLERAKCGYALAPSVSERQHFTPATLVTLRALAGVRSALAGVLQDGRAAPIRNAIARRREDGGYARFAMPRLP